MEPTSVSVMNSLPSRAKSGPSIDLFLRKTAQRGFHNPRFDEEAQVADATWVKWLATGFQRISETTVQPNRRLMYIPKSSKNMSCQCWINSYQIALGFQIWCRIPNIATCHPPGNPQAAAQQDREALAHLFLCSEGYPPKTRWTILGKCRFGKAIGP
jgi:hypothetical protein